MKKRAAFSKKAARYLYKPSHFGKGLPVLLLLVTRMDSSCRTNFSASSTICTDFRVDAIFVTL